MDHGAILEGMWNTSNLSQQKAADSMGVTRMTLSGYFKQKKFKKRTLRNISKASWVDISQFGVATAMVSDVVHQHGANRSLNEIYNQILALHSKVDALLEAQEKN